jgi:hypothetical protein
MINRLHHISLALADPEAGIRAYRELLGSAANDAYRGRRHLLRHFRLENTTLRIVAPRGDIALAH